MKTEKFQLALEGQICGLDMEGNTVLAVELNVDVEGQRKLRACKKIREKIKADLEQCETAAAQKQILVKLSKIISGNLPSLEAEILLIYSLNRVKILKKKNRS